MATQTQLATEPKSDAVVEQKIQKLREAYADAPEMGRVALDKVKDELEAAIGLQQQQQQEVSTAGRIGLRRGKVSELTGIVKLSPGGAKRLRLLLKTLGNNFRGADRVGTLHDMRFVFLDNDTRLLFATAYDGDWDTYIDDFVTKIPDAMDLLFCNLDGWPGIKSPRAKDFIASFQITADTWYVASPNLTVAETKRLEKIGAAVEEFLDKIG
jgi:hypothetical protein